MEYRVAEQAPISGRSLAARSLLAAVETLDFCEFYGRVEQVVGLTLEALGPGAGIGELCRLRPDSSSPGVLAEAVGFRGQRILLMPLAETGGIAPGWQVVALGRPLQVGVGPALLGRVVDGLGTPMDGKGPFKAEQYYPVHSLPPGPLVRTQITKPLSVGVRAMDGVLTCGRGQRLGIFAGSGVGKSTLLGMIARHTDAEVNVIGLLGERGREVRDFLERDLGERGLQSSVVVAATSDQPALVRIKAALVATAIAEYFRDQGKDVLLMMDSLTRFAQAQREVGLAIGEPPTTRGYPPSVFAQLPRLLERSGTAARGSITGFYTVLVDGDDPNEPISDSVRSILDGHIFLSRELASAGHYPAVDVLGSISRLASRVAGERVSAAAARLRRLLAAYKEARDLIEIGAYQRGSNPVVDEAVELLPAIKGFLQQSVDEEVSLEETWSRLTALMEGVAA